MHSGISILFDQQLYNLDSVGSSALTNLVTAAPEADAAIIGQVGTDTAYEYDILIGGIQRHGILLLGKIIHQLYAGCVCQHLTNLLNSYRLCKAENISAKIDYKKL